jgi:hypothetical protein
MFFIWTTTALPAAPEGLGAPEGVDVAAPPEVGVLAGALLVLLELELDPQPARRARSRTAGTVAGRLIGGIPPDSACWVLSSLVLAGVLEGELVEVMLAGLAAAGPAPHRFPRPPQEVCAFT